MEKSLQKTIFRCQNCGTQYLKWQGRCQECDEWNQLVEEVQSQNKTVKNLKKPRVFNEFSKNIKRYSTGIKELDRVLGRGLMPQSYVLLGGEPGIGKSTLLLQMACYLNLPTLYISGEESEEQISSRAQRIGLKGDNVEVLSENQIEAISEITRKKRPKLLIVDSIQTVYLSLLSSAPGSVSQVRECSNQLMNLAKQEGFTVFVIGHITKEGHLAGPKVLEHMVDTVLLFEGDSYYRTLRALKNRFGPTHELGVFQMNSSGLKEVKNPSEFFLAERNQEEANIGSSIFASLEGTRPILCEVQALTVTSPSQFPRRTSLGYDLQRIHLLAAVLEKYLSLPLSQKEIFINVVGGLKISEPSADLAILSALISSEKSLKIKTCACFLGEIGLTGEVRQVHMLEKRLNEAKKLGFTDFILPSSQISRVSKNDAFQYHFIKNLQELPTTLTLLEP